MKNYHSQILLLFIIGLSLVQSTLSAQTINVSTSTELKNALTNAAAGQTIVLTAASYVLSGGFVAKAGANGTSTSPITIKSTINSTLATGSTSSGYALWLPDNDYWVIDGLKLINSKKALILDNSNYNIIQNVTVDNIGEEGIHLRTYSSNNTIRNCYFDNTGKLTPGYGEGIYFGSAYSNWGTYTNGNPDTCDYNIAEYNTFGDNIAAENIDIKEGTQYGIIRGNTFNGKGLTNANSADSWMDIKGNYYTIECNTGAVGMTDGYQTHVVYTGYGNFNTFRNNSCNVGNTATGYGINISKSSSSVPGYTASDNVVCTNNSFTNAKALTNSNSINCSTTTCPTLGISKNKLNDDTKFSFYPNPIKTELTIDSVDKLNNATIVIYTVAGKEVKRISKVNENSIIIERGNLAKGIYFVSIIEGNKTLIKKRILID